MLAQESDEESFAKDYVAHATLEPAVAQAAREDASAREFVASSVDQGTIESRAAAKRAAAAHAAAMPVVSSGEDDIARARASQRELSLARFGWEPDPDDYSTEE